MTSWRATYWLTALFLCVAVAVPGQPARPEGERPPDYPEFDKVITGDFEKREGFLNLYYNSKTDSLMAGIPRSLVGKEFLLATSLSGGPLRGFQGAEWLLRFEIYDKELLVIAPETRFTASGALEQVVNATYPEALIATLPIRTMGPSNEIVVDVKSLLAGQVTTLTGGWMTGMARGAGSRGGIVQVEKAKAFPDNNEITLKFLGASTSGVHYSIARLRSSQGFRARVADPRIGYFVTARANFSRDERADNMFDIFINRWHVEKAEPSLRLSPPKEPIIFYIEKTVPVKYRRWVAEGILMWNKAFEGIGIVGAIQVRQQTDTNEFANLDPEDARYNFFRWITTGGAFAMGPSRANPRTGEILDADIIFDESMLRWWVNTHDLLVGSINTMKLSPRLRQYIAQNPQAHPLYEDLLVEMGGMPGQAGAITSLDVDAYIRNTMLAHQQAECNSFFCSYGHELGMQLAVGRMIAMSGPMLAELAEAEAAAAEAAPAGTSEEEEEAADDASDENSGTAEGDADAEDTTEEEAPAASANNAKKDEEKKKSILDEWPEEMVGQLVRHVVAHEVGHTLGLRHNFKASAWKPLEKILANDDPNEATVASVMDYVPFSFHEDGRVPAQWVSPTIGPYDSWAIAYGYAIPGSGEMPKDEKEMLKKIADRSGEPGLAFLTDEDLSSPDPLNNMFDLGSDVLEFSRLQITVVHRIKDVLLETIVRDGQSYDRARRAFRILMGYHRRAVMAASYFIGGHYITRDHKGTPDAQPPITVTEAARQREAMELLIAEVFAADAFKIDPNVQQYLAASRWRHWGSSDMFEELTFPIQEEVLRTQRLVLFNLLNPQTVRNLYDSEYRVEADVDLYTLPEMMQDLTDAIFSELDTEPTAPTTVREPYIDGLRRNLQRRYITELIQLAIRDEVSFTPPIARTLAWQQLSELHEDVNRVINGAGREHLDAYSRAHLLESRARIKQALDASFTINGGGGGMPFLFIMGQAPPGEAEPAPRPNMGNRTLHPLMREQLPHYNNN